MLHLLRRLVKEAIMSHHRIARFEVLLVVYNLGPHPLEVKQQKCLV